MTNIHIFSHNPASGQSVKIGIAGLQRIITP